MTRDLWMAIGALVGGFLVLVLGGEALVRGASRLAVTAKVSPLVIGLTIVAFGTSAPELAVSVQAALAGDSDIAVGNVVGSNIFNILFILGLSALIVPLVVSSQLIRRDVPLMIGASLLVYLFCLDGNVARWEGAILFAGIVAYTIWCVRSSRRETALIQAEYAQEMLPPVAGAAGVWLQLALIVGGLILLALGSKALVYGAVEIAAYWGVSQLLIGLTIVSVGTSLPEVVTSIVAACRGERDIAVGNVVGSNLFNLLCVLGLSSCAAPTGTQVSEAAIHFDIPVMIAVAVACLPIFFTGNLIARWEGGLFLFYYVVYTSFLVLDATDSRHATTFGAMIAVFALPLTFLTLLVGSWRAWKTQQRMAESPMAG